MSATPLWLLASLAFTFLSSVIHAAPLKVMSAPNLLRVGTAENIFVECQDCTGGDIQVDISVMNHPTKTKKLGSVSVTLNKGNNFQAFGEVTIPTADFNLDPNTKQYVYLQAQFPDRLLEKVVLVSFQSGYIFIQTDKNLYTPDSTVNYRMFGVTPNMEPVERDLQNQADAAAIIIEMMTPEDIVLPLESVFLKTGIYSGNYKLAEVVSPGLWKIVAKFQSHPQQSFTAQFEVKEYVLPSFEVKLLPFVPFFYQDSQEFAVDIRATYLFGEEVDGTAFVVFGNLKDGEKRSFTESLQSVPIERGRGVATLKRAQITQVFPNIDELVGSYIFVSASVLTLSGSEMVEAELRGIQIVTSPYSIQFQKTPKYFKPGMSFDVTVKVLNPDDTPARDVPVVVHPGEVQGITSDNGVAKLTINTVARDPVLKIKANTNDPKILRERQAVAQMEARPYQTNSNSYIHIGVDTAELDLGDNLKINLNLNRPPAGDTDITYLIIGRGKLVKHGRHRTIGQVLISIIVPITKDMLPSFRIVAYYRPNNNEVVSDSVWVDVKDSCMGTLKLESTIPAPSFEPRKLFGLKVTGDPEATVGLVAVDKGVFVLNKKHRLTQKKVWETVENDDTGCTPGGGKDAMSVFYDAGLVFETNSGQGTPYRKELKCPSPPPSKKKRATTLLEVTTTLAGKYVGTQKECCLDGMAETRLSYTCDIRSEYVIGGPECVEAFLFCCKELEGQRADMKQDALVIARSEKSDHIYMDNIEIVTRTNFPESWLWSDIKLPPCPQHASNCDTTSHLTYVPMQDSITTWQFMGISLSKTHGICVGEPLEVIVRKNFFIDLKLPYSAVRGEQIEIRAILHNYSPDEITVRVDLFETADVCSAASKRSKFRQEVEMGAQTTKVVPYIIIPMKKGKFGIEIKAAVAGSHLGDGIMKELNVVHEGVLTKSPQVVTLDPTKLGSNGKQEVIINSQIPKSNMVPGTDPFTQISVIGREQVSVLVENAIAGTSMGSLIYQPGGCGEQNMIHMTLPVIATIYLDKTNQWETVGFQKRNEALQHIKTGYKNQLAYRRNDGSFAVWAGKVGKGSSWLTAYVAKVFAMGNQVAAVQRNVICDAVKFLILHAQQPDGMFREVGTVSHGEMIGDIRGGDSDASMTAFNLIAMQESRPLCSDTINSLEDSENKAIAYLEKRLPSLTNPYAVAMTSYALANKNKLNKEILYKFSSSDFSHWPVPKGHIYTLEATAYGLLALVKAGAFEDARPVVRWFNKQRKVGGGFGSTQATIMVYQAIAEYWTNAKEPDYDLKVDIDLPGRSRPIKFNFNKQNHHASRTSEMKGINQDVKVTAEGSGEATFTMVSLYYALPSETQSDCQDFDMTVKLIPERITEEEKIYKLKIEVMYLNKEHDATMSILDIGLLTGFRVDDRDLGLLSKGHAPIISKFEINTVLSEKGSLIIYLNKVSHKRREEISFRIIQTMKVGILQPAAVSVYEYYNQRQCVKFYHPERKGGQLLKLCTKNECTCAEENCSLQKKGQISNDLRVEKSCESTPTNKIDYVYQIELEQFKDGGSTDIYTARVKQVIKEGNQDVGAQGQLRTFLSYPHCRDALELDIGKSYLIMGSSRDIHRDDERKTFHYILGETTWIEYWPTTAECQTPQHRPTCLGMELLIRKYEDRGCEQ
ncbi:complement C3-like [Corythoichthys intestinalis]|uniref:complement C3-like n=1 Tax=Corythoichthys intestinalis TaxID=161448 RepID=UPI0025A504DB|nr:complement C3-like [Corythoichthys intestinalis]XP_061791707.1 complement C3-like [Nerophis lumbriciformis]